MLDHELSTGSSKQRDRVYAVRRGFGLCKKYLECMECAGQIILYASSVLVDRHTVPR